MMTLGKSKKSVAGFFLIAFLAWLTSCNNFDNMPTETNVPPASPTSTATFTPVPTLTITQTPSPTNPPSSPSQSPILPEDGSIFVSPKDGMKLGFVAAGEFLMGSEDGAEDETPIHSVYIDDFWIDQTEVTNAMYALCVKEGTCREPLETYFYEDSEYVDGPVVYVTWDDANNYCTWADRRLPTEAEWEKAASWDGTNKQKRIYPWGDTLDCSFANIYGLDGDGCAGIPVNVGSYPLGASYYGILDMAGNALEWVADLYNETYYQFSPFSNPRGPANGRYHVLRGSSFIFDGQNTTRQSEGFFSAWPTFYDNVGFRCAKNNLDQEPEPLTSN